MGIRTIGIIGQGALGVMYGNHLTKKLGNGHVFFIADETRVERYRKTGMSCNGEKCGFTYRSPAEAVTADLIIFAVKFMGMESAIRTVKPFVGENTLFLSVLNGISSEGMIEEVYGADHVLYACVQGMDAGKDGSAVTYKNMGYITIGNKDKSRDEKLKAVTDLFDRTGLSYQVPDDILREQWNKLMLNTGVNQVTGSLRRTVQPDPERGRGADHDDRGHARGSPRGGHSGCGSFGGGHFLLAGHSCNP